MLIDKKKTAGRKLLPRSLPRSKRRSPEEVYLVLDDMLSKGEEINLRTVRTRLGGGSFRTLMERLREWKHRTLNKFTGGVPVEGDVMVDEVLIDNRVKARTRHLVYQVGVVMELPSKQLQNLGQFPSHVDTETLPGMFIVNVTPVAVKLVMNPTQFADFQLRVKHGGMFRQRQHPPEDLEASDHAGDE